MSMWILNGPRRLLTGRTAGRTQIIDEFRSKLRMAEDLISKLTFSVREIHGVWKKSKDDLKEENAPVETKQTLFSTGAAIEAIDPGVDVPREPRKRSGLIELARFRRKGKN